MTSTRRGCGPCTDGPDEPGRANPPGQPALVWGLGNHDLVLRRMRTRLPAIELDPPPGAPSGAKPSRPLAKLNARAPDDPSVALLDAAAVVADVLAFYQDRIVNEGFLRTAIERRSVLELARAVGYELKPGLAAGALLAFVVDDVPGGPTRASVAAGTRVQSVPGQNELPQTFETVETIEARAEYNVLRPRLTQPQRFAMTGGSLKLVGTDGSQVAANRIYLASVAAGLKPGDMMVLRDGALGAMAATVHRVTVDGPAGVTTIDLVDSSSATSVSVPLVPPPVSPPPVTTGAISATPRRLDLAYVKQEIVSKVWTEEALAALIEIQRWNPDELTALVDATLAAQTQSSEALALRQRVGFFGAGAPAYRSTLPPTPSKTAILDVFKNYTISSSTDWNNRREEIADKVTVAAKPPYQVSPGDPNDWDAGGGRSVWTDSQGNTYASGGELDVVLERTVPEVTRGSWMVMRRSGKATVFSVLGTVELARVDYATTGKVMGISLGTLGLTPLSSAERDAAYKVRSSQAFVQSERVPLASLPIVDVLEEVVSEGGTSARRGARAIVLDRMVLGLAPGRTVIVSGTVAPTGTEPTTSMVRREAATLSAVIHSGGLTTLYFAANLADRYLRASVTIAANVARATHGESVRDERLGSGDAAVANQRFTLGRPPLTLVSAQTPSGGASTLVLRVDGVAYDEVPSLYGQGSDRPVYTLRTDDDGVTTAIFGDGVSGARLPTGLENVVASYRTGIGTAGEVGADRLTLLHTRPLGVRSVSNPLPASGGDDRERLDDARRNAPLTVLTLGRIVSLRDYEDFARAFAGIGKAQASPVWNGHQRILHVTVASASGGVVDRLSDLYRNLVRAIRDASDGTRDVQVDSFQTLLFRVQAELRIDPRRDPDMVRDEATTALRLAFDFDARGLGQRVTEAELLEQLQSVSGVRGVRIAKLTYVSDQGAEAGAAVDGVLAARMARWEPSAGGGVVRPAELLLVHPAGIVITAGVAP